mmetsp:Transcript_12075/g.28619  ORF Transcript_12075/g.28619 Transcript_12075/m.28619 type:complete len:358 (+) Transcript_12075:105-1178(+)
MAEITPIVTRDPRFLAGRELVERGLADEAVETYATLLEETRLQYGDASIETAPAYFEYGNTILRAVTKQQTTAKTKKTDKLNAKSGEREIAATATEKHTNRPNSSEEHTSAITVLELSKDGGHKYEPEKMSVKVDGQFDGTSDNNDSEDLELSLEMIENSFSILEEYKDSTGKGDNKYAKWVERQLPRILVGIGDNLSKLNRHGDAADAYSRALELRKACFEEIAGREGSNRNEITIEHLKAHRMVCEAYILIAEELLMCPNNEDILTTETHSLIVKADERLSYARGYYDQARDVLQEVLVCMGSLPRNIDLGREKENVCFLATLVMGVGEQIAATGEKSHELNTNMEHVKKKARER